MNWKNKVQEIHTVAKEKFVSTMKTLDEQDLGEKLYRGSIKFVGYAGEGFNILWKCDLAMTLFVLVFAHQLLTLYLLGTLTFWGLSYLMKKLEIFITEGVDKIACQFVLWKANKEEMDEFLSWAKNNQETIPI